MGLFDSFRRAFSDNKSEKETIIKVEDAISFPNWYISLSFGKSSSANYEKAVMLAKMAPQYHEQVDNGQILHQAIYSAHPKEYLSFISLYELVSSWKSSFVIINGEIIDRKIISSINYCYGDKCRSGDPSFCFGASNATKNPFGCHRLQISAFNHPWWSFYNLNGRTYYINRQAIIDRVNEAAQVYHVCPCFNYDRIMNHIKQLPETLTAPKIRNLEIESGRYMEIQL